MRLFVAVHLPEEIQQKAGSIRAALAGKIRDETPEITWVKPEHFHVTLKFLGECPDTQVPGISRALADAVQDVRPFSLTLGGLGCFSARGPIRAIWLGLQDGGTFIGELAARVEAACETVGFKKEQRPFSPHLTLARVKKLRYPDGVRALLDNQRETLGKCDVREMALMQSKLSSSGPTYTRLQTFKLGEPSPPSPLPQ